MYEHLADKLQRKTVVCDDGCWMYIGGWTGSGYGAICDVGRKTLSAHVVSYSIHKGEIPKGMRVLHTCDHKYCVNPDHLFLGTTKDNKDDEINKGRHAFGERQGNSKLSEDEVVQIKRLLASSFSGAEIGRMFNVTPEAIYLIKKGTNWRHVP